MDRRGDGLLVSEPQQKIEMRDRTGRPHRAVGDFFDPRHCLFRDGDVGVDVSAAGPRAFDSLASYDESNSENFCDLCF